MADACPGLDHFSDGLWLHAGFSLLLGVGLLFSPAAAANPPAVHATGTGAVAPVTSSDCAVPLNGPANSPMVSSLVDTGWTVDADAGELYPPGCDAP